MPAFPACPTTPFHQRPSVPARLRFRAAPKGAALRERGNLLLLGAVMIMAAPIAAAFSGAAAAAQAPTEPSAQASAADLPLRRITLYRSGVAAMERDARIDGPRTFQLRFRAEEIDDLLRSMVLLDLGGGQPGTVAYASRDPLERRLGSLRIDLTKNPSIIEILAQLRGARVRLELTGTVATGTVLGTEMRGAPVRGGQSNAVPQAIVNMLTDEGIRSVSVEDIRSFRIMDAQLAGDLDRALAAAYEDRAEQIRTVEVSFRGEPGRTRDVLVSYVQEAPVWKTSYRLVLADDAGNAEAASLLQAWAIVENATDEDWRGVTLSLASGRPVAFRMRLADPIYAFRPELPVPAAEGIRPRDFATGRAVTPQPKAAAEAIGRARGGGGGGGGGGGSLFGGGSSEPEADSAFSAGDFLAMAGGDASGADVGGQFLFTVDAPITLDRRRSAMIPLATRPIPVTRLSILDGASDSVHPMRGAEMTNESGLDLLPGPIAVYDGDRYAGDATILHTARGQKRLLAYALDTDLESSVERELTRTTLRVGVRRESLRIETSEEYRTTYHLTLQDAGADRRVIIEHPRRGTFELVEPDGPPTLSEVTPTGWRLMTQVRAGETQTLTAVERRTSIYWRSVGSHELDNVVEYVRDGRASEAVLAAVRTIVQMQAAIADHEQQIAEIDKAISSVTADQSRIRSNLGAVPHGSDLHDRYLRTLSAQEDELERLRAQRSEHADDLAQKQAELAAYLRTLNTW